MTAIPPMQGGRPPAPSPADPPGRPSLVARLLAAVARRVSIDRSTRFGPEPAETMLEIAADVRASRGRLAEAAYVARELAALARERRRFGAHTSAKETAMFDDLRHDLRWALRLARRRPLGTITVVVTLALTIAAAATAYGVATAVLWRPLPFADSDRLVLAWEAVDGNAGPAAARVTSGRYAEWRKEARRIDGLAAFGSSGSRIEGPDGAQAISGVRVTANFFDTLGIAPMLGRLFLPADEVPGAPPVLVASYGFWRRHLGGRPDAVGSTVRLGDTPFTVVGVMPNVVFPGWPLNPARVTLDPGQREYWIPIARTPQFETQLRSHLYGVVGRLAPGESIEAARAELTALVAPDSADLHGAILRPLREQFVGDARTPLVLLLAAALAVLLIACANLAAVQVTVMHARRDELAVRAAIGAGRWRLARQLLVESLVLAVAAGAGGLLLARLALTAIPSLLPPSVPLLTAPRLDLPVALFGGLVALACGLVVSAWPVARVSGTGPTPQGRGVPPRRAVYRALVVGQVAVTVPLVATAALLAQSLWSVRGRDAGFAIDRVLVADLGLQGSRYDDARAVVAFEDALLTRAAALPGVVAAALSYDHPLEANWTDGYALAGDSAAASDVRATAELRIVSPGYFGAMGVRLVDGRLPASSDDLDAAGVVVVNEAFARTAPVQPVLGRHLRSAAPRRSWDDTLPGAFEIIGVVRDERFRGLEAPSEPAVYMTTRQFPLRGPSIVARTIPDPESLAAPLRALVRELDAAVTFSSPRALGDILDEQLVTRRVATDVVSGFAGLAIGLAALGLYGLLVVAVAGRTREFGVRLALGAAPGGLAAGLMVESLRDAAIGVAAGLALAFVTGRLVSSMLVDVTPADPRTLALVAIGLLVVAVLAAAVPARRAATVDPANALRPD